METKQARIRLSGIKIFTVLDASSFIGAFEKQYHNVTSHQIYRWIKLKMKPNLIEGFPVKFQLPELRSQKRVLRKGMR